MYVAKNISTAPKPPGDIKVIADEWERNREAFKLLQSYWEEGADSATIAHSRTATAYRAQALLYAARGYEFTVLLPDIGQLLNTQGWQTAFKTNNTASIGFVPNPASNTASIAYNLSDAEGNSETATLHLYDTVGKLLHTQTLNGQGSYTLDLNSFGRGLYVYDISNSSRTWTRGKLTVTK